MTNAAELNRWIPAKSMRLLRAGECRLLCFPYAGAGASIFRNWQEELPACIELVPIQLPGRESRWSDRSFSDLPALAETLVQVLRPLLSEPYALYGHSMGTLIAFELARELRRREFPLPRHLFLSAARAPHVPDREPQVHHLPDVLLWKEVMREYSAAQDQTPLNPELAPVLLPILRADFRMCESYQPPLEAPLPIPITAYGGWQDRRVTYSDLAGWRGYTGEAFRMHLFPGGHFFPASNRAQFLKAFAGDLTPVAGLKKH